MPRPRSTRPVAAILWCIGVVLLSSACTNPDLHKDAARNGEREDVLDGVASYYARSLEGRPTASGELYDANRMTAAHRTLPLGTRVRVTEPESGKSVVVRINDRGPYVRGRTIDLSRRAAEQLGIADEGVAPVTLQIMPPGDR